jgi:cell wall assembly regulator SMI1
VLSLDATLDRARAVWDELIVQARADMPGYSSEVEPPATNAMLDALQTRIGRPLPIELRALYLVHDGGAARVLPEGAWIRSMNEIARTWDEYGPIIDEMYEDGPRVITEDGMHFDSPYDRSWVPFATREDFDLWIDLEPGPAGLVGQVLYPIGEATVVVVASDVLTFLERWVALSRSGTLVRREGIHYPLPPGELSFPALFGA